MPRSNQGVVWVAKETFACADGIIHQGVTRVREGHPLLDAHREKFERADAHVHFDVVEQATAAPGEKRNK